MATHFIRNKSMWIVLLLIAAFLFPYLKNCFPTGSSPTSTTTPTAPAKPAVQVDVPSFSADSAYAFVQKQVDFGPRVPGTPAHKKCATWLSESFKRYGLTVIEQDFTAKFYFGDRPAVNIIAQYKPEEPRRILLCAHWDSRHIADKDSVNKTTPILGADDGGSGIGILLEVARLLQANPVNIGVDLICFDAEDLGDDRDLPADQSGLVDQSNRQQMEAKTWCLGSQYWARNLHKPGYTAQFGILLDLVGAKGAVFPKESFSMQNAPIIQEQIWTVAANLGYETIFPKREAGGVTDDHVFVTLGTRIPTVDIISIPTPPPNSFGTHHHTHKDNMSVIDRGTLGTVGQVITTVLYRAGAGVFL